MKLMEDGIAAYVTDHDGVGSWVNNKFKIPV